MSYLTPRFRQRRRTLRGVLLGLGHPDLLERPLGFRLQALRQLVQDIGGLVHPAALLAGLRPHVLDCLPEAERAVGDRELGTHREPTPLQIEKEFPPGLRTIAHAIDEADQLLRALGRSADDDQHALRRVLRRACTWTPSTQKT